MIVIDYTINYQNGYMHGDLVNKIGVATLNDFAVPILDGSFQGVGSTWTKMVAMALGAGLGFAAARKYL